MKTATLSASMRLLVLLLAAFACAAHAQPATDHAALAKESSFVMRDFTFASGEKLPELRINYATWGEPKRGSDGKINNAILLNAGTMGPWRGFAAAWWANRMFGPGQPLDLGKYFIIAPDNIGAGKSSKPSDGMGAGFPKYRTEDVVRSQYRLVTESLGIEKLVAVIGISYGGRQAWQWAVQYPDTVAGVVPLVASPFPNAGRRGMQDFLSAAIITSDPTWNGGSYKEQPRNFAFALMAYFMSTDGPGNLWDAAPTRERSFAYLPEIAGRFTKLWDANDFLYQMRVNDGFDAFAQIERVKARVLMINMAGDEMVPMQLGHADKVIEKLGSRAEYLLVKEAAGRGHLAVAFTSQVYAPKIGEFVAKLKGE